MAAPIFRTVADDLVATAETSVTRLRKKGYAVKVETPDHAAPFMPTVTATRGSTTLHIEVVGTPDIVRVKEWVAYGKSSGSDTRLAVCIPSTTIVSPETLKHLADMKVGLFVAHGNSLVEQLPPADLAMHVELPSLDKLPGRIRALLGHAYEQFDRGEWREGFEEACNVLEDEARGYLVKWAKTGRIRLIRKSGPYQPARSWIKKLSLGQLAKAFGNIVTPNSLDSTIEQALSRVNPDRVERTHRRRSKRTETRLRRNVGQHMWLIVNVIKQM